MTSQGVVRGCRLLRSRSRERGRSNRKVASAVAARVGLVADPHLAFAAAGEEDGSLIAAGE